MRLPSLGERGQALFLALCGLPDTVSWKPFLAMGSYLLRLLIGMLLRLYSADLWSSVAFHRSPLLWNSSCLQLL